MDFITQNSYYKLIIYEFHYKALPDFPTYCQALFRAQQECAQLSAEQEETRNVLSATYQKEKSQAEVYEQWVSEWYKKLLIRPALHWLCNQPISHFYAYTR